MPSATARNQSEYSSGGIGLNPLDGSYSRWSDQGFRPYLPREQGRGSVELHGVFYDGQLEPTLRVEGEYRGPTLVPGGEPGASGVLLNGAVANAYSLLNLYLQIRIVDVRAFLFWENLLNQQEPLGLDRFLQPGPRLVYGGRWFFRN